MTAREIATIGYQGAPLAEFLESLREAGVATVIDVRATAWSRNPAYAKSALAGALAARGLGYVHLPGLGNPFRGEAGAWRERFAAHLDLPDAQPDLLRAAALARAAPSCLLCLERHPEECHRAGVADKLAALTGLAVRHLAARAQRSLAFFSPARSDT